MSESPHVYIVTFYPFWTGPEDSQIVGVYSTQELADGAAKTKALGSCEITEHQLDVTAGST